MRSVVVVDNPRNWPLHVPGIPLLSARDYLAKRELGDLRRVKVFNLCRSYRYQSTGYYVSLLAQARGHTPLPSIATIQDMRTPALARVIAGDLHELAQRRLRRLRSEHFVLSVYFGRNTATQYDDLSLRIFRLFQAPLLQAYFRFDEDEWRLYRVRPIAASEINEHHRDFVIEAAKAFFARSRVPQTRRVATRYDLAVLRDEDEATPPSNAKALQRLVTVARRLHVAVEFIDRQDYARLPEFDALFIRETTQVDHYTYRFARRAAAEGLAVIDDPDSIIKCTNKVYLAELLERNRIPTPRTQVLHRDEVNATALQTEYPCIIKQPDSSFSQGVFKVADADQLRAVLARLFEDSELLILQEFVPTEFDWRIGVLDRQPLYACKYHMVKAHWQIARSDATRTTYGDVEAVRIEDVPAPVLKVAVRAANAIGSGLYGVDAKLLGRRAVVIEVNDNPNLEAGDEDGVLGDALYERLIQSFIRRIEQRRGNGLREGQ